MVVGDEHPELFGKLLLREAAPAPQFGDSAPKVIQDLPGRLLHGPEVEPCEPGGNT